MRAPLDLVQSYQVLVHVPTKLEVLRAPLNELLVRAHLPLRERLR